MPGFTITFPRILILCLWWQGAFARSTSDDWDDMGQLDKVKMKNLAHELLVDVKVKQRQIFAVRSTHKGTLAYEIGLIIGKIREHYKRMNDIYREAFDRKTNRTNISPPAIRDIKALHWILMMEMVHSLEVDIDKLVQVIELIPKSDLGAPSKSMYAGMLPELPETQPVKPPRMLRAGNDTSEDTTTQRFKNQDELKKHYREKYNARSGMNTNWSLDEYYGIV